jgi:hypothetical protein
MALLEEARAQTFSGSLQDKHRDRRAGDQPRSESGKETADDARSMSILHDELSGL